ATNGITVSNCDPQIRGCYIYDNTNHGIYVINGASPELQYNTIKNNDGSGIYNNGSSETFCEISGTGENDIMNNSGAGVYNNGGFVHLGPYMGAGTSYYNTISGNNGEINNSNGSVEAQKCYWGTSSPTYQLFLGSGITDWQNYLTSDQADGSPLAKNAGQNWEDIENNIDRNNPKELYMLANYLREQSRSDEAGSVFKDIIIRFPNSSVVKNSVRKLFLTERKLGKKYIIDYVKSLRNGKTLSHIDNALCEILLLEYVRQNDVNNVEKLGKEIIKNYSNRDSEKMALYNLSTYQGMGANNRIKYLDIMKTKYPNDPITLQALVLNGEDVDWTQQVDGLEKSISGNIETVAADFSLNPAYPNPFNPSTTISFSLSKQSKIDIQVYDLKGKKVWNWENNLEYGIGNHKVVWNAIDASGNSLSTGVYFIKLIAGEQVATQKVILMK
ncbi:MAG: T9SS type A sorting domain-containing protein, partial [Fidelibacterota bacterium]